MANIIAPYSSLSNGAIPILLVDNGDGSYYPSTYNTGAGVGSVIVPISKIVDGTYKMKFIDNGDGSYSIGVSG